MMTHASTIFPWSRSFSVHVEMYSRGSNSRGRRSSFTTCWSRRARRRTARPGKTFAGSASIAHRRQAHDGAERDEHEGEEPQSEREVWSDGDSRAVGESGRQIDEHLVQDEQDHPECDEADSAAGASMP